MDAPLFRPQSPSWTQYVAKTEALRGWKLKALTFYLQEWIEPCSVYYYRTQMSDLGLLKGIVSMKLRIFSSFKVAIINGIPFLSLLSLSQVHFSQNWAWQSPHSPIKKSPSPNPLLAKYGVKHLVKEQGNKHGPPADSLNGGFIGDTFFLKSVGQSTHHLIKKTTYALKTPRVVALPFMYGVEY